jgi:hypothetical protein
MKLSELYAKIQAAGDVASYVAFLAAPDRDGVDVDLAAVGRVELDTGTGDARLYPTSMTTDDDSSEEPEPFLLMVLEALPKDVSGGNDLRLMVESPLIRDESGHDRVSFVELQDIHIGPESKEAWLLLEPASTFARGLLPT